MTIGVRPITPSSPTAEFHCDEFRRDAAYTNWRPKGSGDWLLIYTVNGSGRLVSSQGVSDTHPGDVVLYAPGEPQDYSTAPEAGKWHLLWAHFMPKPHWQAWLHWPAGENGLRLLRIKEEGVRRAFHEAMRRMVTLSRRPLPIAVDLATLALEEALLWAKLAAFKDQWVTMDDRVRRAINYLTNHFREPFQFEGLARHCGLSVSRLAHLFKAETGLSPQCFLEQHRMQMAARLLRLTGFTITEVAADVGYADPFYFSNRFRRYSGKSPSQFRMAKSR
jgi:AraC family transcriptional regulator of arabinose operon